MAGNNRLIFPVRFDLEGAVKDAQGNATRALTALERFMQSRPINIPIKVGKNGGDFSHYFDGLLKSGDAVSKQMDALIKKWQKMPIMDNKSGQPFKFIDFDGGKMTKQAEAIVKEFLQLTAVSKTAGVSLTEMAKRLEQDTAAKEKAIAKSRQLVAMLKAEETSIAAVAAKQKFYQDIANKSDFGSKKYQYATEQVDRLGAQLQRLKTIMNSNTGNTGKDQFGLEQMRQTLRGSESTIEQVQAKLKVLNQLMAGTSQGSYGWARMTQEAMRLNGVLDQMKAKQRQATMPDDAAYQKWLAQKEKEVQAQEQAEQRKSNATRQAIAKQNAEYRAEEEKRYQEYWNEKQREVQANEQAEARKRAAQQQAAHEARSAAHKQAQEAYQTAQALRAQEDVISNLTKKLQIYNQQIQGQKVGTTEWNNTALNIRRVTEELERANQRMRDFQQAAFRGLNNSWVDSQVQKLTQYRAELKLLDKEIHAIQQWRVDTGNPTADKDRMNNLLDQRIAKTKQINDMLKSGADLQLEREKQISAEIERRNKAQEAANNKNQQKQANYFANKKAGLETQKMLQSTSKSIDAVTKKLDFYQQKLNKQEFGSVGFKRTAQQIRQLTQELEKYQREIDKLTGKQSKVSAISGEFRKQETYISRLIKRMMVYASASYVMGFLSKIREVTAEFELQRVSLGAILQDQAKAELLFSKIKGFALQSPVKILDLTKYTKQLAAYRIGYDDLFDTMKRLTDVSVGLGVSMDRVILAYGQVRATGYLRASEVRQFTEMGVPIVEELAAKLSKMNGEMVRASDVMEMISKREIPFEMVSEVFQDMTDKGGLFYNMQEKQGNTLYGLWAKLGDAASVMYDQIGNTGIVSDAMKAMIRGLTDLMRNWRSWAKFLTGAAAAYIVVRLATLSLRQATMQYTRAGMAQEAMAKKNLLAAKRAAIATRNAGTWTRWSAKATLMATNAQLKAAQATNLFSKSLYKLKAAFLSNPLGIILTVATTIFAFFMDMNDEAERFEEKMDEIDNKYVAKAQEDAANFKKLANEVVNSANGSKKQKDALDELNRTYKDALGVEEIRLDTLREMNGEYGKAINLIDRYNAKMKAEEKEGAIKEFYSTTIKGLNNESIDQLATYGHFGAEFGKTAAEHINRAFVEELEKGVQDLSLTWNEIYYGATAAAREVAIIQGLQKGWSKETTEARVNEYFSRNYQEFKDIVNEYIKEYDELAKARLEYTQSLREKDKHYDFWKKIEILDREPTENLLIEALTDMEIENIMKSVGATREQIDDSLVEYWRDYYTKYVRNTIEGRTALANGDIIGLLRLQDGLKEIMGEDYEFSSLAVGMEKLKELIAQTTDIERQGDLEELRKYLSDMFNTEIRNEVWTQTFWDIAKVAKDTYPELDKAVNKLSQYTIKAGETTTEYSKRINDAVGSYAQSIKATEAEIARAVKNGQEAQAESLKGTLSLYEGILFVLKLMKAELPDSSEGSKSSGQDQRLGILQEIVSTLENINKEYDNLTKKEGAVKALADAQNKYASTFKYLQSLSRKYKFGLPDMGVPTSAAELKKYLEAAKKAMEKLPKSEKAVLQIETKMADIDMTEAQNAIEKQLKDLADRISRTKTAKEFYEKILNQTGDWNLAESLSSAIYSETGAKLREHTIDNIQALLGKDLSGNPLRFGTAVRDDLSIDYDELERIAKVYLDQGDIAEDTYNKILKMRDEDRKDLAKTVEEWLKATEKAKTFADKMIDLERTTSREISRIMDERNNATVDIDNLLDKGSLTQEEQTRLDGLRQFVTQCDTLIERFKDKQQLEMASLQFDAFKDTPLYVQMFEDLEHTSTSTLEMMKAKLIELRGVWGETLTPTQIKEMQSRLNEIDEQLQTRNPFKTLREAYANYTNAVKNYSLPGAQDNLSEAQDNYNEAVGAYGADSDEAHRAQDLLEIEKRRLEIVKQLVSENKKGGKAMERAAQIANEQEAQAQVELAKALAEEQTATNEDERKAASEKVEQKRVELELARKTSEVVQEENDSSNKFRENLKSAANSIITRLNACAEIAHGIANVMEALGGDENDIEYWNTVGDSLSDITSGIQDVFTAVTSGDLMGAVSGVITALPNMFMGFVNLFSAGRVRKANKEIARQQKLLDQLEYTYSRLEKISDKLFGSEYISNFNTQLKNLEAQQKAYQKQLEAEKSKGKKADKDRIKEYEDKVRDTADEIKDMQEELTAHFTGKSRQDAAKSMAESWIDAKVSMSNTFSAITDDYKDMIKNMLVETMAAKVIENAFSGLWEQVDELLANNDIDGAVKVFTSGMDTALNAANSGMEVWWNAMLSNGYDMRDLLADSGDSTGIARDIASASEESINGLAAGINTQNFYIAQIHTNVAKIVANMNGGISTPAIDYTPLIQQSLDNQGQMIRYQAETLAECKEIAMQCTAQTEYMRRVIFTEGGKQKVRIGY